MDEIDLELRLIGLAWYVVIGGSKIPIAWPARVKNFDIGGFHGVRGYVKNWKHITPLSIDVSGRLEAV